MHIRSAVWLACVAGLGLLGGCSSRDSDLDDFIARTKAETGAKVEPLREFHPYEPFSYTGADRRSPFVPGNSSAAVVRQHVARNREFLEQFSLDTLKMVGTLTKEGKRYGLLQVRDGRVQRVSVGNYVGQNDGRITEIDDNKILVTEVVPDGLGGYVERPAAIAMGE